MTKQSTTQQGAIFVLLAAMLWGTTGTAQALAPVGFDSTVIGTLRLAIGGVAMLLLAIAGGDLKGFRHWPPKTTLAAALFTALYQLCFFAAVAKTGVAVGTVVGIGSAPVAGGVLGALFQGEHLSRRWYLSTGLAIFGCSLLALSGGGELTIDLVGIALAVGAGASYAAYTLMFKRVLSDHAPNAVIAVVFCLGSLMLSPLLIGKDLSWIANPRGVGVILHLGLVTAALSYWLFARGLQSVQVSSAVTLSLAEPLTAAILGLVVLGETLNVTAFVGIGFVFGGLSFLAMGSGSTSKKVAAEMDGELG